RLAGGGWSELLSETEGEDIRFLREAVCVRLRSRHPERRPVQHVDVGERLSLERVLGHPVTFSHRCGRSRHSRYAWFWWTGGVLERSRVAWPAPMGHRHHLDTSRRSRSSC